jgi:hypothetical protein
VLVWLAWMGGRRTLLRALAGGAVGLLLAGVWGYVRNLDETGRLLGAGQGRVEATVSPSFSGTIHTAARVLYRTFDLSVFSNELVGALAVCGLVAGVAVAVMMRRRAGTREAAVAGASVAIPFLAPLLVLVGAAAFAWATRVLGIPVRSADRLGGLNRAANEDVSAFGSLGTVALLCAPLLAVYAYALRRAGVRQLALALTLPSFLLLLGLYAEYNPFLTRFMLVPAVLTAPLFAHFFGRRAATASIAAVAALAVGLALGSNEAKSLRGSEGLPWTLSHVEALAENPARGGGRAVSQGTRAYDERVPRHACVGAVLDPDEPSYPLWGPSLGHRVLFLPSLSALQAAYERNLSYVVISTGMNAPVADQFAEAGWKLDSLEGYWILAVAPGAGDGDCRAAS